MITIASIIDGDYKPAQNPTTDGRYVFWQDYRATGSVSTLIEQLQATTLQSSIMGYDLQTGAEFPVVIDGGYNVDPQVRNGVLVWEHHQTMATDPTIYSEQLDHAVPSPLLPRDRSRHLGPFPQLLAERWWSPGLRLSAHR